MTICLSHPIREMLLTPSQKNISVRFVGTTHSSQCMDILNVRSVATKLSAVRGVWAK